MKFPFCEHEDDTGEVIEPRYRPPYCPGNGWRCYECNHSWWKPIARRHYLMLKASPCPFTIIDGVKYLMPGNLLLNRVQPYPTK